MQPYRPENLPLKDQIDWTRLVPLIAQANAELARYDGTLQGILNPSVLLSPLTTQEAVLSSRIEGTEPGLFDVLKFEATKQADGAKADTKKTLDIEEILNYRRAMWVAEDHLKNRPISLNFLKQVHSILLEGVRGQDKRKGEFRTTQNWLGKPGCKIEEARFVPPNPIDLLDHLSAWEKYVHYEEKDKLVQAAIIHGQFEIIHPFVDGNGRVGRMLIPLFLYEKKAISTPMFYISEFLEANREAYASRLNEITTNKDWNSWIEFFLTAIAEQAKVNAARAKKILTLYGEMKEEVPKHTRTLFAINALDAIFKQPIFSSSDFIKSTKIPQATASRIMRVLCDAKITKTLRKGSGRRPALLVFERLIDIAESK